MLNNFYHLNLDLVSVFSAVPKNYELNTNEGRSLFGNDIDKIIRLTGINKRHIAQEGLSVFDLSFLAAKNLLDSSEINKKDIKVVLYVSFTHENNLSGDVNKLISLLGLPSNILSIDIKSACSGYLSTTLLASSILTSFDENSYALVIDGDVQSKFISKQDRATYPILGDASTASLFKKSKSTSLVYSFSKGSGQNDLIIKGFSSKFTPKIDDFNAYSYDGKNSINNFNIFMNGLNVYKFVLLDVLPLIKSYLSDNGNDFNFFVPHQANLLIVNDLAKHLDLVPKTLISLNEFGNVGSCSIPLTISKHLPNNKDFPFRLLISGFGAGLAANVGFLNVLPYFKSEILYV
jgi:3-oxoacyl-[acyl-carrier-protein] synthase-3